MRSIFLCLFFTAFWTSAYAQRDETLLGRDMEFGGFGGVVVKVSELYNGDTGVFVGGRGGWIINRSFYIGGGGYGLANRIWASPFGIDVDDNMFAGIDERQRLMMGYGGLEIGYISHPSRIMHHEAMLLVGAGGVTYGNKVSHFVDDFKSDTFFVLEPGVNLVLNITTFMRGSAGLSYRFISGIDSKGLSNADLAGVSVNFTVKFGSF